MEIASIIPFESVFVYSLETNIVNNYKISIIQLRENRSCLHHKTTSNPDRYLQINIQFGILHLSYLRINVFIFSDSPTYVNVDNHIVVIRYLFKYYGITKY